MFNRLVAALLIVFIALTSAALFPVALIIWLLTVWWDKRLVLLHLFTCLWASLYLWIMPPWRVRVVGKERIRLSDRYIIVSNHQSQLDILIVFRLFLPFKWVSKAEVFRLPFIGWNMYLNRYIKLKRGDKRGIQKMFTACEREAKRGCSIYLFPEGTRSKTGRLKPFKPGAFILAQKMKMPILPIAINGTHGALPKHSLNFHGKHDISLTILEPIGYERFAHLSVAETADMVRSIIAFRVDLEQGFN
jgi:1-acyl-sn-glycerol-3-phosphate acyltransferase